MSGTHKMRFWRACGQFPSLLFLYMLQCTNLVPTLCFCSGMVTFFAFLSLSFSVSPSQSTAIRGRENIKRTWAVDDVRGQSSYKLLWCPSCIYDRGNLWYVPFRDVQHHSRPSKWDECVAAETMFNFWQTEDKTLFPHLAKVYWEISGTSRKWSRKDIMQIWLRSGTNSSPAEIIHHTQKQSS